jgi:hypothetical protein
MDSSRYLYPRGFNLVSANAHINILCYTYTCLYWKLEWDNVCYYKRNSGKISLYIFSLKCFNLFDKPSKNNKLIIINSVICLCKFV